MSEFYLDFEKPIKELDDKLLELQSRIMPTDEQKKEIEELTRKRQRLVEKIFSGLTRWQRVQLARHPNRPYSLDYIQYLSPDFFELHGDRHYADDASVVAGIGTLDGNSVAYVGQQKGRSTKENIYRNFGMMSPEGYRKARRVIHLAEKFGLPVISLIDTSGAYPGIGAEERGQAEAIARNLFELSQVAVPILVIVIGEGASGGALGIGIGDVFLMLENTWFSVISPEGCASILWHDAGKAPEAADAMRVAPQDLVKMGICDRVIAEPLGGAHTDPRGMCATLKQVIIEELTRLQALEPSERLNRRMERYERIGSFVEK